MLDTAKVIPYEDLGVNESIQQMRKQTTASKSDPGWTELQKCLDVKSMECPKTDQRYGRHGNLLRDSMNENDYMQAVFQLDFPRSRLIMIRRTYTFEQFEKVKKDATSEDDRRNHIFVWRAFQDVRNDPIRDEDKSDGIAGSARPRLKIMMECPGSDVKGMLRYDPETPSKRARSAKSNATHKTSQANTAAVEEEPANAAMMGLMPGAARGAAQSSKASASQKASPANTAEPPDDFTGASATTQSVDATSADAVVGDAVVWTDQLDSQLTKMKLDKKAALSHHAIAKKLNIPVDKVKARWNDIKPSDKRIIDRKKRSGESSEAINSTKKPRKTVCMEPINVPTSDEEA